MQLPMCAEVLLMAFASAFSQPTFERMLVIGVGAVLARGRRTVTNIVWTMGELATGDCSAYHRVFSRAPWNLRLLGRTLAGLVIELVPDEWVVVAVDDTTAGHKGAKVYGKGCHHDAVRSSHVHTAWKWGHRWVVLAVIVKFPFASRPWALPVLAALYRPKELNRQEGRRHKTPAQLARQLMAHLLHWFPERKFLLLGDGGYASHELASFCHRHGDRVGLVSRFHADAALYDRPPAYSGNGRPRVKGRRRRTPGEVVADGSLSTQTVRWYGCTDREVQLAWASAHWYKAGRGLVPVQWVFVRDSTGTRRDEFYYCTLPDQFTPAEIVGYYTQRWTIEVTFQEVRAHLGFETPRQRVASSVQRMAPLLLGLYSLVSLIYHCHTASIECEPASRPWYEKSEPTFSDALESVRRLFWTETVFQQDSFARALAKTPSQLKNTLLNLLCQAA